MGFLSFFTFCVRLRCVLFFSCTIKVPFLIKIVYQNGTSRLIIYKNPPLVKPFFKFFIFYFFQIHLPLVYRKGKIANPSSTLRNPAK